MAPPVDDLRPCPKCKLPIRRDAGACPHCGTDFYTMWMRRLGTALILTLVVVLIWQCAGAP